MSRKYYSNDPRIIIAKFESKCAETGITIKAGEKCIYYPSSKSVYTLDSNQAKEFREYMADLDMGANY